jgi:hypothetical protein
MTEQNPDAETLADIDAEPSASAADWLIPDVTDRHPFSFEPGPEPLEGWPPLPEPEAGS